MQAQNRKRAEKLFSKAKEKYRSGQLNDALRLTNNVLRADTAFNQAFLLRAEIANQLGDTLLAIKSYENFLHYDSTGFPPAFYNLAGLYFKTGQYQKTVSSLLYYINHFDLPTLRLKTRAQTLLKKGIVAAEIAAHPCPAAFKPLPNDINTLADEYVNFINEDLDELYFTRKIPLKTENPDERRFVEKIFVSRKPDSVWMTPEILDLPRNTNLGALNFSIDGRIIYFTGCYLPTGMGSCDIYFSVKQGDQWLPPHNAGPNINSPSWDSQAAISSDGRIIFFTSKRGSGFGGSDIWYATRNRLGGWNEPENAGDKINTSGDEMAPLLFGDNSTLYFSSTGHYGLGGFDLFVTRLDSADHWQEPENMGIPYNSRYDDINIVIGLDARSAWISSNRNRPDRNFDIFYTRLVPEVAPEHLIYLKGVVLSAKDRKPLDADIVLTDLETGLQLDSTRSDALNGTFLRVLHPKVNYGINISRTGYLFLSKNIDTRNKNDFKSIRDTFLLQPVDTGSYTNLYNITFDFDKADLKPEAMPELKRLLHFLKKNPQVKIEIAGHTDRKGGIEYNLTLSQKRAKAVYDFLINNGITGERLTYKGYGFQKPLCREETEACDTKNRRTEIVITGVKKR